MKVMLAMAALLFGVTAAAADYAPLQGSYKVGAKTLIDAPSDEAQDTHFYVDLEGGAARDLYQAMRTKPVTGTCGEPGDQTKRQGGVQCTRVKDGREYHCAFGIELLTQKVVTGVVC